jgi:hypothetical protein
MHHLVRIGPNRRPARASVPGLFPAAVQRVSAACPALLAVAVLVTSACGPSHSADRGVFVATADALGEPLGPVPTPPAPAPAARPAPDRASAPVDAGRPIEAGPADVASEKPSAPPVKPADAGAPVDLAMEVMTAPEAGDLAPPAPAAPFVQVSYAAAPSSIDLTASGAIDWAHFGYQSSDAVNRKRGVTPLIGMTLLAGASLDHYDDRPVRFSWTDGTPVDRATNIADGVDVGETEKRGFQLRVEGNTARPRVLELYVGAWNARARLEVRLVRDGANSPVLYMDDSLAATAPGKDRVYRIVFQPAAGQKLVVSWLLASMEDELGNVTLQAAVLAE